MERLTTAPEGRVGHCCLSEKYLVGDRPKEPCTERVQTRLLKISGKVPISFKSVATCRRFAKRRRPANAFHHGGSSAKRRVRPSWHARADRTPRRRWRPKKTLRKGVKVRLKNKGSQRHQRGPKRPKYEAPYPEHPDTEQRIATKDIHANHLEAFNTSLRRRCAAYRRRTNMYAKNTGRLQERLNVYWMVHNFVRVHFTTRQVPAVALGVLKSGLSLHELFFIQKVA